MSKIALLCDTHFGGKLDNPYFHDYLEEFYTKQFFPYLKKHKIKNLIHLGDIFDRRKYTNHNSLDRCKDYFFSGLASNNIYATLLVGNHDTSYKSTNYPNTPELFLGEYNNIDVIAEAKEKVFDGCPIVLVPWINEENSANSLELIEKSTAKVLFGHLEVAGFCMHKGFEGKSGLEMDLFSKYNLVCSGHYHHKSHKQNIHYLGAPYQITWHDYDDVRGFHIFDTKTLELEYVPNSDYLFNKIKYNDLENDYSQFDCSIFRNKYIKLIVEAKSNHKMFDGLCFNIEQSNPIDLKIIEDFSEFSVRYKDINDVVDGTKTTADFLNGYVKDMDISDTDKIEVKTRLNMLYKESMELE